MRVELLERLTVPIVWRCDWHTIALKKHSHGIPLTARAIQRRTIGYMGFRQSLPHRPDLNTDVDVFLSVLRRILPRKATLPSDQKRPGATEAEHAVGSLSKACDPQFSCKAPFITARSEQ